MSFARWRQDGFDADLVASELAEGITPLPTGGLQYSGTAFFGEPLALLETGVEFLVPISDLDRSRIITRALETALRSKNYGQSALIGINKSTRDFVHSPKTKYVVATGFSFRHFEDLARVEPSGSHLYVRRRLPRHLAKAHKSAFQNPVGDRRVASKDGQISASIPLFWACSDPHRHLEWRF